MSDTTTYTPVAPDDLKAGDKVRIKSKNGTIWIPAVVVFPPLPRFMKVRLDNNKSTNTVDYRDWLFEREDEPLPTAHGIYMSAAKCDPNLHTIYRLTSNDYWMYDGLGEWSHVENTADIPRDLVRFLPETGAA